MPTPDSPPAGFERLTPRSREAWRRASARVPAGVTSNVRYFPPHPVFMERAHGARLWDVDGREYLDYCLAFGPQIAGHGHPHVLDAIAREIARAGTTIFGAPTTLEMGMADRLARLLPSAEMVRFTNSGTEATMHALRLARGVTGRTRVIKFEGHYHGVHDAVLFNLDRPLPRAPANDGIPPETQAHTTVLPFNDLAALEAAFEDPRDLAAVIVEPIARGVIEPDRGFLERLRSSHAPSWSRPHLRRGRGVAAGRSVWRAGTVRNRARPDGARKGTRGRPAAGGRGRHARSDAGNRAARRAHERRRLVRLHGGTYNGTPIALAAGHAVLDLLEDPGTWTRLQAIGQTLRDGLAGTCRAAGIDAQVIGRGALADFYFTASPIRSSREIWTSDLDRRRRVDYALLADGVFNVPLHRWHVSLAHTEHDVAWSLERLAAALAG